MYWTSKAPSSANLEAIYSKGLAGVEELLEVDNIILRARNGDERLLRFLSSAKILERLVVLVLGDRKMEVVNTVVDSSSITASLRYPLVACDLLTCDQTSLSLAIREHWRVLKLLWQPLSPARLQGPFTVYWSRLLLYLLGRLPEIVSRSLMEEGEDSAREFIDSLVPALARPEVAEVVLKLFTVPGTAEFLAKINFLSNLFSTLLSDDPQLGSETVANSSTSNEEYNNYKHPPISSDDMAMAISGFVLNLLSNHPNLINNNYNHTDGTSNNSITMETRNIVQMIVCSLEEPLKAHGNPKKWSQNVFIAINDILSNIIRRVCTGEQQHLPSMMEIRSKLADILTELIPLLCSIISASTTSHYCSSRGSVKVVGMRRLKSVALLADILLLDDPTIAEIIAETGVVELLVDFLFIHQHNSILLSSIVHFVNRSLVHPTHSQRPLLVAILQRAQLVEKILHNQRLNDAKLCQPRGTRLENMGHVTLIVDNLLKFIEANRQNNQHSVNTNELLFLGDNQNTKSDLAQEWQEYVNSSHRETKLRDGHILGGSKAPTPPELVEDAPVSGNGLSGDSTSIGMSTFFAMSGDEQLARYFCQQVIANLPHQFLFHPSSLENTTNRVDDDETNNHDNDDTRGNSDEESSISNLRASSIEIPVHGGDLDDDEVLEMEMRQSSLGDDNYDEDGEDEEDYSRSSDDDNDESPMNSHQ